MTQWVDIEALRVGMFVHLDRGWWAHPFALSSFMLASPEQIGTVRSLGIRRLRWSPEKSQVDVAAAPTDPAAVDADGGPRSPAPAAGLARPDDPVASALQRQRAAEQLCCQQIAEARRSWQAASDQVDASPHGAKAITDALTAALLAKLMVDGDVCVRVLSDAGVDPAAGHALNVAVLSLLLGRVFELGQSDMHDLGVGALLHDIGKIELADGFGHPDTAGAADSALRYREHVDHGVRHGRRMGLPDGAMRVLAQHHEMADGSGFPHRLPLSRMTTAARIVALVNRYDNLCNPRQVGVAMTPHEALATLFARHADRFDGAVLNAFIRMMGVYPPGSIVQLSDERYAAVVSVDPARPLAPRVMVCDPAVPAGESLLLDLGRRRELGIRRSLKPAQLPATLRARLSPCQRMVYFFEPIAPPAAMADEEVVA